MGSVFTGMFAIGLSVRSQLSYHGPQLAEAILTTPTSSTDPDIDDAQSILLADTRTGTGRARENGGEREQFLVGSDDGDGHSDADRERTPSIEGEDRPWSEAAARPQEAMMGNFGARRSWVDVTSIDGPGENGVAAGAREPGLSAKAGIILVRVSEFVICVSI